MSRQIDRRDWDTLGFLTRTNDGHLCHVTKIMCNLDSINPGDFPPDTILRPYEGTELPDNWSNEILLIPDEFEQALWAIRPLNGGILTDNSDPTVRRALNKRIFEVDIQRISREALEELNKLFPDIKFGSILYTDCEELMHALVKNHGAQLLEISKVS